MILGLTSVRAEYCSVERDIELDTDSTETNVEASETNGLLRYREAARKTDKILDLKPLKTFFLNASVFVTALPHINISAVDNLVRSRSRCRWSGGFKGAPEVKLRKAITRKVATIAISVKSSV
jgi:hypothetical protein